MSSMQPGSGTAGGSAAPGKLAQRADRIISGIDLIDYGVGGLYPDKIYVVKGAPGTGKSVVGLQFLSRGLELGEPGVLITAHNPANVVAQAKTLGFHVEEASRSGQLQILNPSNRYFQLVESPSDVMAILEELTDYMRQVGAKRLVIDPVYTLVNTAYSSHFALSVAQSLVNALEELPMTTMLIAGDDDNADLKAIAALLEQNAFGVISLAADKNTGGRIMRLSKLRYASTDDLAAHYRILDGRGLINYRGEGEKVADVTKPWEETSEVRRSVLILGASDDTVRKVTEALGSSYQVSAESDLTRGLERVREERPGLVLITPSRSMQAVNTIVELSRDSSSAIALLSPSSQRGTDKVLYLRAGADDFIAEPFSGPELRARVEALIRRSGRRLNTRDASIPAITSGELSGASDLGQPASRRSRELLSVKDKRLDLDPDFRDRLQRNLSTVSQFGVNYALYWIKSLKNDPEVNRALARLCRTEDVLCHNASGEFVAILTGADENGVRGFESRLEEKLGNALNQQNVRRGYAVFRPDESTEGFADRLGT